MSKHNKYLHVQKLFIIQVFMGYQIVHVDRINGDVIGSEKCWVWELIGSKQWSIFRGPQHRKALENSYNFPTHFNLRTSASQVLHFFDFRYVQKRSVQATYWHDPKREDTYRHRSTFLAELNNEVIINQTYVDNLKKLNKWVKLNHNDWYFTI